MPRNSNVFDVLISCPGDITDELKVIDKVVAKFNGLYGEKHNVSIQTRHWSKDSFPQSGGKPQSLLNKQFIDNCDAAIALFWTRFGTPTDKYSSGTEEEIENMIKAGKQVFIYICDKPVAPSSIDSGNIKEFLHSKKNTKAKGYIGHMKHQRI